jgi:hypothetical protein
MRLFKKQNANSQTEKHHGSAKEVWKQVRERLENGAFENMRPCTGWAGKNTAKEPTDDSPVK